MTQTSTQSGRARISEEDQKAHDAAMASAPVEYRGYLIKPVSLRYQPHFISGKYVYFGFIPVYVTGEFKGCHAGPGATWSRTVGGAKTMIDCLHEAGHEPPPYPLRTLTREESEAYGWLQRQWTKRFWDLMKERRE